MGKGDMKTRRGKLFRGSYGKIRPRKKRKTAEVVAATPPPARKKSSSKK